MNSLAVSIRRLPHGASLPLPSYATGSSAGVDLMAAVETPVTLQPGARAAIPSGIAIALPAGFEAQVRPRSGLALSHGVTVLNTPGTIDADYRGEIKVILVNMGEAAFAIEPGMRIAQMVVAPVATVAWKEINDLPDSTRGSGGFGSTGVKTGEN